ERGIEHVALAAGGRDRLAVDPDRNGIELQFSGLVHQRPRGEAANDTKPVTQFGDGARTISGSVPELVRAPSPNSRCSKMARMAASVVPGSYELRDDTPYSTAYGDVYHSADGGPAQARHVFLAGNELPARWARRERYIILETGFGFGLNFLVTWRAWKDDPNR